MQRLGDDQRIDQRLVGALRAGQGVKSRSQSGSKSRSRALRCLCPRRLRPRRERPGRSSPHRLSLPVLTSPSVQNLSVWPTYLSDLSCQPT